VGRTIERLVLQGERMYRKLVGGVFVLALCIGVAMAEEINGVITKVEGNKVTFAEMKGKEKGAEKTLTVSDKLKVVKGKFNKDTKTVEAGEAIPEGLKAPQFTNIGERGVRASIVTEGDKITEIRVMGGRGKKKDN
jgi:hypothetical protein